MSQVKLTDKQQKQPQDQFKVYKQSPYRYLNLVIYLLAALVNSLPTQTFSSINSLVTAKFNYNQVLLTLNTLFFPIFHPIFAFPANWILDKYGMKIGCVIGGVLVVAGVWLRTFLQENSILLCLIGSALAAVGNIFILNSSSILANNWFKHSSIPLIITLAVLSNLISITLGGGLPGLLLNINNTAQDIRVFLRIQAIVISVPFALLLIFMRSRPTHPPSRSAENQSKNKQPYKETLSKLARNKQYLKIMLMMTLSYGTTTSYLANCQQNFKALGYTNSITIASQIILSAMVAGIFTSFIFIKVIKETLKYRAVMAFCNFGAFLMFVLLQVLTFVGFTPWSTIVVGALTGVFMIPTTSLYMAYSSQVIFPLGQGSATGYLFAASQTFGFLIGLGSSALIKSYDDNKDPAKTQWQLYLFTGSHAFFLLCAFIVTFFTKNLLNRTNFLKKQSQRSKFDEDQQNIYQSGFIYSAL